MYESGEDYLETILIIQEEKGRVRSVDVARKLAVSKPSVSRAMGILKNDGYIIFDENQRIVLTEKGFEKASNIYGRHKLLTAFLMKIAGVPEEQAEKNACRAEHVIDSDIVAGIDAWMKNN